MFPISNNCKIKEALDPKTIGELYNCPLEILVQSNRLLACISMFAFSKLNPFNLM